MWIFQLWVSDKCLLYNFIIASFIRTLVCCQSREDRFWSNNNNKKQRLIYIMILRNLSGGCLLALFLCLCKKRSHFIRELSTSIPWAILYSGSASSELLSLGLVMCSILFDALFFSVCPSPQIQDSTSQTCWLLLSLCEFLKNEWPSGCL